MALEKREWEEREKHPGLCRDTSRAGEFQGIPVGDSGAGEFPFSPILSRKVFDDLGLDPGNSSISHRFLILLPVESSSRFPCDPYSHGILIPIPT